MPLVSIVSQSPSQGKWSKGRYKDGVKGTYALGQFLMTIGNKVHPRRQ